MGILLNENSEKIIKDRLNIEDSDDLINKDFKDINLENDIDKEKIEIYQKFIRGSVRLSNKCFQTVKERKEWIQKTSKITLP